MTGIFGIYSSDNSKVDNIYSKFSKSIGLDCDINIKGLSMTSRRLISDNGSSADETGKIYVCFEGEIYNKKDLPVKKQEDAQIVSELYSAEGEHAFDMLEGMYAFSLYDGSSDTLYLVRDRAGEKPLYYAQSDGAVVFSGDLGALSSCGFVSKKIDNTALCQYLLIGYIPSPLTIYENITAVRPAEYIKISKSGLQSVEYWCPDCSEENMLDSMEQSREKLREALIEGVESRLPSGDFGVFLSGGIDSTVISGIASRILGRKVNTFTMGFNVDEFDESDRASIAAKAYDTEHHLFRLDFDYALQKLDDIILAMPQPFADRSAIPTYIINEFAKKHLDIVLTGDGSDQMFAGSNKYLVNHYADKYEKIPRFIRRGILEKIVYALPENNPKIRKIRKVMASSGMSVYERREQMLCLCTKKPELKKLIGSAYEEDCMKSLQAHYDRFADCTDELTRTLYMDLKVVVEGGMIAKMGTMSRSIGIETRTPMVSRKMMETAYSISSGFKQQGTTGKVVLKQAFDDIIPEQLKAASKKGFDVPLRDWFCSELKQELISTLDRDFITEQGIFDYDIVNEIMQSHFSRKADRSNVLWALYVFTKWAKRQ